MKLHVAFTLVLLGMVTTNVQAQSPEVAAALIESGVDVYKEIIGNLKEGVKGLFIAEELTKVAKSLAVLNIQMEQKQKDALNAILAINIDAQLAIDSSRVVVSKLRNICDTLIFMLDSVPDEAGLKATIETYLGETKLLGPDVDKAIEKLITVSAVSVKVDAALIVLNRWAEVKKQEIGAMTSAQIAAARAKAYGGAAACVAAGPWAFIACPIAYAIASGVTEGKNVKEIKEAFDGAIAQVDGMRKDIKSVGDKTKKLVQRVKEDKNRMVNIQSQMDDANRNGRLTLGMFNLFFNRFKTAVTTLLNSCKAYIAVRSKRSAPLKLDFNRKKHNRHLL